MEYWAPMAGMATRTDETHQIGMLGEDFQDLTSKSPAFWLHQPSSSGPMLLSSGQVAPCAGRTHGAPLPSTRVGALWLMHGDGLDAACSAQHFCPCCWHGVPGPESYRGLGAVTQIYTAPSDNHCCPPQPRAQGQVGTCTVLVGSLLQLLRSRDMQLP